MRLVNIGENIDYLKIEINNKGQVKYWINLIKRSLGKLEIGFTLFKFLAGYDFN